MRRNSGDSYKGANASDGYAAISDEAAWENYSYCNGVNCSCFRSDCNPVYFEKDFSAITFLTLAATQFRDVRNMERNTLQQLDGYELVPRGNTYIEGIALVFESRNYLAMLTSFATTFAYIGFRSWIAGVIMAIIAFFIAKKLMSGKRLHDLVEIEHVPLRFEGAGLYIDNIYIMNIGLPARQEEIMKYGMGFILKPKSIDAMVTISNLGQRQAILHDVSVALGIYRDSGTPALVPLAKRDLEDGRVGIFVLPQRSRCRESDRCHRKCTNVRKCCPYVIGSPERKGR